MPKEMILLVHTSGHAFSIEKALKKRGIACRLTPIPRKVSSDCGICVRFDPEALDAFLRLVDKGVINLDEIYDQKRAEIQSADHKAQEELARRVEEDRKLQASEMKNEKKAAPTADGGDKA